jgi:hypothetical protein
MPPVTFVYTNSHDVTTDLLVSKLGSERIFRFNFDLWPDYELRLQPLGFQIKNPSGRIIGDMDIAKFLWRKPKRAKELAPDLPVSDRSNYIEEEFWYMMREVVNLLWMRQRLVLVEPFADGRCGKLVQANIASRYLVVPSFVSVFGGTAPIHISERSVVKSLSSTRLGESSTFYTTEVKDAELDPAVPWTIQQLVEADKDVTIVAVRDQVFAFELARGPFIERTLDWRELATQYVTDDWVPHRLPPEIEAGVKAIMHDLGLHFGRIDMLFSKATGYHFLEVNPNGEWGWLDPSGSHGLLDKILQEIAPHTPLHPLPIARLPQVSPHLTGSRETNA